MRKNEIHRGAAVTHLLGIHLPARKSERHVIRIHDPACQAAYNGRIDMMDEGNLLSELAKVWVAHRAIHIACLMAVACGQLERGKAGVHRKM